MTNDYNTIFCLSNELGKRLSGCHIAHLVQYGADVFYFHLSKGGRLTFCLDNQNPYIYISTSSDEAVSLSSSFGATLRKELGNALIKKVEMLNEDRVISFEVEVINDVFKSETRRLNAELIPGKANLILVGSDGRIIAALRTNSPSDPRPIVRGLVYETPNKGDFAPRGVGLPFDFSSYNEECEKRETVLSEKRKRERFHALFAFLLSKKKSSKRKIEAIENDIAEAKKHLSDGEFGDFIYMNMEAIDPHLGFMKVGEKEIPLDPKRNKNQNAQMFYKRQKKAKLTYSMGQTNLAKARKEQAEFERLQNVIQVSDETGLESLSKEYGLDQFENRAGKTIAQSPLMSRDALPYSVVHEGVTYVFGKSAVQNDFLSFLYDTSKKHTWMHLIGRTGAHLMIKKDNASPQEIALAAEILCVCSNLNEGEAMYALRKDVRKGRVPGEAIVKTFKTIRVGKVSSLAHELYLKAAKADLQ